MVVLAAAIISKSGKALVSRQYVDMSSIRMEGLLATFPKLIGTGEPHSYVETHNVRYVYQPMESLYLLLVTNKQSNILEDREILRLLSKLVPEYVPSLDEEGICRMAFELVFAFDEVISLGHKENVTNSEIDPYVEMESHEERLRKRIIDSKINDSEDIMKHKANDIEKNKIEKSRGDKGSFASSMPAMGSSRFDNGFGYPNSSMGGGMRINSSGFGSGLDTDVYKSKVRPTTTSASSMVGAQLGKSTNTNHFFESEVIVGDVAPRPIRSAAAASLMGVHILDDETEMFFSRQVSNARSIVHNAGAVPFTLKVDPRRPLQAGIARQESSVGPLTPPSGSRPVSGILYPGQFGNGSAPSELLYYGPPPSGRTGAVYPGQLDMGSDAQYAAGGIHFSEMLFKKLVRAAPTGMQYDGVKAKKRGEGSSETLDRHFGHYSPDMRYDPDNDSISPTSTLDHHDTTESSPSTESDRFYPSRNPNLTRYLDAYTPKGRQDANTRPSSQLAQCLLSLTAMADDTTDEDDIIFEQPSTSAPLWHTPPERPVEPHLDWPIVQFQAPPSRPHHRHPQSSSNSPKNGRTLERWSSNSSSWNLSLLAKPKAIVTSVPVFGSSSKPKRHSKRHTSNGDTLREIHNGASSSTVLTYDRSGDAHGRHKWERDSSSSSPSVEEIGFEAYDRPGEMVHTLDEEDFPFSPIASSFVFGEHNNSVEFSQRGGRNGIPRAVGPIVQEFASSNFEIQDFQESMSTASEGSHTYSLESGFLQPELDWVPTKSFHYIKGRSVEIVELGTSNRVFNGYIEINHSGRFSIDLQRGPRLERHLSSRYNIEKTPDVLLRIVEEAHSMSSRRRSNATKYANCRCLPVPKKGLLGRCLTSNQTHRVAVANSFESRLRSRSLGSVNAKNHPDPSKTSDSDDSVSTWCLGEDIKMEHAN